MIQALKLKTPNYTPGYNCTSAAVKLLQGAGISVPNGVGKVNYNGGHVQYQANPWSLHLQLNATTTVPVSVFP
jgi:hypothetical protein